jgi:hypothetical protein
MSQPNTIQQVPTQPDATGNFNYQYYCQQWLVQARIINQLVAAVNTLQQQVATLQKG